MTHLPYIAASYGLTLGVIASLALGARRRLARARRQLAACEAGRPRRTRA